MVENGYRERFIADPLKVWSQAVTGDDGNTPKNVGEFDCGEFGGSVAFGRTFGDLDLVFFYFLLSFPFPFPSFAFSLAFPSSFFLHCPLH